jgi:hypothetical protein
MNDSQNSDREFFRAPAKLYVFYGPESAQSRQAMALNAEVWRDHSDLEASARRAMDEKDVPESMRGMLNVLRWMDFKLDIILSQMRSAERQAAFPNHLETTDISGAGIGMVDCGQLKIGERIIMAFTLPDSPSQPIYCVGEVVRVADDTTSDGQARAAVRFEEIAESDRERVIRFTFNQQRRLISQRKGIDEA